MPGARPYLLALAAEFEGVVLPTVPIDGNPRVVMPTQVNGCVREEGCALEVNSQAERLDLTDSDCLAAKHAGVKLVVSSDAHHPRDFAMLEYGVNQARRGWIEPGDVLNTRPAAKLRQR